ncbi:kinase-like domain-containing protein [Epithele typhae]|uniref:kinase-like domain-containing protein n=1 Tax=Epithele typhae TaxID=378194 RepID=UPI0020081B61|nr:kinase-like domain-containing protein [Epithele typhae]KAH9945132.1 kinase-like domain-containing protein [Epithele typhae]
MSSSRTKIFDLPRDLRSWRHPPGAAENAEPAVVPIWDDLKDLFNSKGYVLWTYQPSAHQFVAPESHLTSSGFMGASHLRDLKPVSDGVRTVLEFQSLNPLTHPARTANGQDVVIRVLAVGSNGLEHLHLLNRIATGMPTLVTGNHTLPLLDTIELQDVTFGVFPKAGGSADLLYGSWIEPSEGDILHVLVQCLEALRFLHGMDIAHRDVFKDNFLLQWYPESMLIGHIPTSRPRVYLTDFELAVSFPRHLPREKHLCVGMPLGGSMPDFNGRPMPAEVLSGKPYDPYKLDVWQLATAFCDWEASTTDGPRSSLDAVRAVLARMRDPNPKARPSAHRATEAVLAALAEVPPKRLQVPAVVLDDSSDRIRDVQTSSEGSSDARTAEVASSTGSDGSAATKGTAKRA